MVLNGAVYPATTKIRHLVAYSDNTNTTNNDLGDAFNFTPTRATSALVPFAYIAFYADMNNNTNYDPGEPSVSSPTFKVLPLNQLAFTYDVSSLITPALTVADVQAAVDLGVKRLRMRDSEDDFRAAVKITVTAAATPVFTPGSSHPDPIVGGTTGENDNFGDMGTNYIRFISGWVDAAGIATLKKGQTEFSNDSKVIVAWPGKADDTIVHEIGHTLLVKKGVLGHNDSDTMNIMHGGVVDSPPGRDAASNKLSQFEADTYSGL